MSKNQVGKKMAREMMDIILQEKYADATAMEVITAMLYALSKVAHASGVSSSQYMHVCREAYRVQGENLREEKP